MAAFVLRGSILNKLSKLVLAISFVTFCTGPLTTAASAQHAGGHPGAHPSGGGRIAVPASRSTSSRPVIARPHASPGRPFAAGGARSFRVPMRPGFGHRHPAFVGAPFFRFAGPRFHSFDSFVWPACGYLGTWEFGCGAPAFYGTGFENYFTVPAYVNAPYLYGELAPEQVWLYLKDGTVFSVIDYWFVNGQIHFTVADEPGTNPVEQVIDFDELDVQRTIDVNTGRGFRVVMRDQPWEKYLHDHPDLTPPPLAPPQNK